MRDPILPIFILLAVAPLSACKGDPEQQSLSLQEAFEEKWRGTTPLDTTRADLVKRYGADKVMDGTWRGECTTVATAGDVKIQVVWSDCKTRQELKSVIYRGKGGLIAEEHRL